jgi:hypothetical protein
MEATNRDKSLIFKMCEVLWAIALISLPVTTFPLFSTLTGALVAPLSILPIFLLLLLWVLPFILHKGAIAKESIPILVFTLAAIISCAAAYFILIPGFKGKSFTSQEIRALFTLGVGLTFYLVTTCWVKNTTQLKDTWKYITIGGILSLLWTGVQAFFILRHVDQYPGWLEQIQSWFVVQSPAFSPKHGRVNGLTYEASWFAHQMVLIYLPVWLAASYHKTSAFKFRFLRLSIENVLVVLGVIAFFLSSPRIGLISLFLLAIYFFMRINLDFHKKIVHRISTMRFIGRRPAVKLNDATIRLLTSSFIAAVYLVIVAGVFFFAVQRDWRLSVLMNNPPTTKEFIGLLTLDQNVLLALSHRFIFLERMVYWMNGWNIFNQYPWFGVGLGNAGFFFPKFAPAIGWAAFEIRDILFYLPQLPNIKSLWFRLLAETGLIGFSLFLSWMVVLYRSAKFSQQHPDVRIRTFSLAGQLAVLALIGEGFSIDSFAMPYLWIAAGIIAATGMIVRASFHQEKANEAARLS